MSGPACFWIIMNLFALSVLFAVVLLSRLLSSLSISMCRSVL